MRKTDSSKADSIIEPVEEPIFMKPWRPLTRLLNRDDVAYAITSLLAFAALFVTLTELPTFLADSYGMSADIVGVCYLPVGVGLLLSSVAGGKFSDISAKWYKDVLESRLITVTISSYATPIGILIFGWSLQYRVSLAAPLIGSFFVGVGQGAFGPGLSSYLSGKNQSEAGAVLSAVICLNFVAAGIFISVAVLLVEAMGIGWLSTLLAFITFSSVTMSGIMIFLKVRSAGTTKVVHIPV